ncbi:DNA-binding protein [Sinorhizobium meliloti]|uniref:helix-turn-helix transcriptional regulator n=1 Tax=Rhizobium meliloti TaxID=382 RepID=UPI000FD5F1EE|nr:helix-turn-helix domain-containing protein [Sinorhizobium meliloti]RVG92104.1 DNA-binding protein [Sinorhizobium meliloti]RVP82050.1 DNA-binding protein [Sinorhizobium meliloti]
MKPNKPRGPKGFRYLSTQDVMQRFGISRFTLRRWHEDEKVGFPKPVFINRRHYYRESDVFSWELKREGIDPDVPDFVHGAEVVSGVISDYGELVDALKKHRESLKMTVMELDARSGMQEGYTTKLENWARPGYGRGAGPDTLPLWLGGLRLGIVLVSLPRAPRHFQQRAKPSVEII